MTQDSDGREDVTIMTLGVSEPRRWLGVASTGGLAILLTWITFSGRPAMAYQLGFLAGAALAFWAAVLLSKAGQDRLVLTSKALRTESGRLLTTIDNVKSVERGAFAFKPPNGFLVRLKEPSGSGWVPGFWWQRRRVIGVGGVVGAGQARAMAEIITALKQGVVPDIRPS